MTNVQVRDVPENIVDALRTRAAERGESLQRYLAALLVAEAAVVTNDAMLDSAATDADGYPAIPGEAADEVAAARAER